MSLYSRGPRSGPGYVVPVRHHLIGPIRPTRRHISISPLAAYMRCPRCAGAPRRPASGSGLLLLIPSWHAILSDPGEFVIDTFQNVDADLAFTKVLLARHSRYSRNPFHAGLLFRGFSGSLLLRPAGLFAPLYGSGWNAQPSGAFTSRLSTDRSPFPLLDIATTVTGLLCWRDSHPLEWQLASLHLIQSRCSSTS
jgi:hypothetical protein